MAHILVVDDEHGIRDLLFEILSDEGHFVELAENASQAREARSKACPDLVLLDIWMPDTDGISLLKEWSSNNLLKMPVIMMSGHATIDTAVQATKLGAMSFLEKPITLQKLMQAVEAGLKRGLTGMPLRTAVGVDKLPSQSNTNTSLQTPAVTETAEQFQLVSETPQPKPHVLLRLDVPLRQAKDAFDASYFGYHLQVEGGSVAKVAERTGLERTHLYRKLKQLGIDTSRAKNGN